MVSTLLFFGNCRDRLELSTIELPHCFHSPPAELVNPLRQLAVAWAGSRSRPHPDRTTVEHWRRLIGDWATDETLPLLVRKASVGRGRTITHTSTRRIIPVDNSPAVWAFAHALRGERPTIVDLHSAFASDEIPVAMVLKAAERAAATYRCTLKTGDNVNSLGWKLAHIEPVGLQGRVALASAPIDDLRNHFVRLMSPGNMFLVPLAWAGLGEVPELIAEIRTFSGAPMEFYPK